MDLLFLTPQLPYPPQQGTSLRNFNIIRGLADRHNITVLSFTENGKEFDRQAIKPLADCCQEIVTVPVPKERSTARRFIQIMQTGDPDMALRLRSSQFDLTLRKLISKHKFDVVQVEGIRACLDNFHSEGS